MTLALPYPPTTNHAYTVARGRKVKTKTAREYATKVQAACNQQAEPPLLTISPLIKFKVTVIVHPPDRRKRDLANVEKLAVDAVFNWLGVDDSRIDELHLIRDEPQTGGLLLMSIEMLT